MYYTYMYIGKTQVPLFENCPTTHGALQHQQQRKLSLAHLIDALRRCLVSRSGPVLPVHGTKADACLYKRSTHLNAYSAAFGRPLTLSGTTRQKGTAVTNMFRINKT